MTAFTSLPNGAVQPGGRPRGSTITALRDNPIAMFEGDATAPKLQFAALDVGFSTAGGIGSYCFARATSGVAFGATIAGSALFPTSAAWNVPMTSGANTGFASGAALSGTWRCMGSYSVTSPAYTGGGAMSGATLWLRIS